jgi:hypothetical protein
VKNAAVIVGKQLAEEGDIREDISRNGVVPSVSGIRFCTCLIRCVFVAEPQKGDNVLTWEIQSSIHRRACRRLGIPSHWVRAGAPRQNMSWPANLGGNTARKHHATHLPDMPPGNGGDTFENEGTIMETAFYIFFALATILLIALWPHAVYPFVGA